MLKIDIGDQVINIAPICNEIVEKYVEMNIAHPFQKGNGRSIRIWLDQILKKELGKVIDWSLVDKEEYLTAMKVSPIKDVEIKMLLKAALTDKINNKKIFMKNMVLVFRVNACVEQMIL